MVGISTIEVQEPLLYRWIADNRRNVCGGTHSTLTLQDNENDYRKQYTEEFQLLGLDPQKTIKCVGTMFPAFAKKVHENDLENESNIDIRRKMRVAQPERFELYFMFDMETVKVPRTVIEQCIYEMDERGLKNTVLRINSEGNILYFFEELNSMTDQIPQHRLANLAYVLLNTQLELTGGRPHAIFPSSARDFARTLAEEMIRKIKESEERFAFYCRILKEFELNKLGVVAYELRCIENEYRRFGSIEGQVEKQLVDSEQLKELERLFLKTIGKKKVLEDFFDIEDSLQAFFLWEDLDAKAAQHFLHNLFKDKVKKIKFLCEFAGRWNGTGGSGWAFSDSFSSYLSEAEMKQIIKGLDRTSLNSFTKEELWKMASFVLTDFKNEPNQVSDKEARDLVDSWMNT